MPTPARPGFKLELTELATACVQGPQMSVVLFEDEAVALLDPVALGKAAFAINCGGYRLVDIVEQLDRPLAARVRGHLTDSVAQDFPALQPASFDRQSPTLWVNARLVPSVDSLAQLRGILRDGKPGIVLFPN